MKPTTKNLIEAELQRLRRKGSSHNAFEWLTEGMIKLGQALMDDHGRVRSDAANVAALAVRLIEEGDPEVSKYRPDAEQEGEVQG